MQALDIYAGAHALSRLRERGLSAADINVIPAAAGGPKGLVLNPLDRFIFGEWLPTSDQPVHLLGASIGAWRMATACLRDPAAQFELMARDYIHQDYEHAPGRPPKPRHVSEVFAAKLHQRFGTQHAAVLGHPRYRLHVFTSRGLHVLRRQGRLRMPVGYAGAFLANVLSRRAMGGWIERVVFSDPREPLPLHLGDYRTSTVPLDNSNLELSLLASCSIPFWLDAVHDIPGAPAGAYWDGGITDYHLHLDYGSMHRSVPQAGLVLYPHFQKSVIPGWLDKALKHRHRATAHLDNVVLLAPRPEWVATLPNGKLPDRGDFKAYGDDLAARIKAWQRAVAESQRLADEFAQRVGSGQPFDALPLA